MRNIDVRRPKIKEIKWQTQPGQAESIVGLFFLMFFGIFLSCQLQLMQYRASALHLEDALAASNLASAVIDLEEYGISKTVQIKDPEEAYELFQAALLENLELDEEWMSAKQGLIDGKVIVEDYVVYNVIGRQVFIFGVGDDGLKQSLGVLGEVKAPNGLLVETTGIYSEISYPVNSFLGETIRAHKGKLVDIAVS